MILPNFPKNCMKLRKFWAVGGGTPGAPPLDPPLLFSSTDKVRAQWNACLCTPWVAMAEKFDANFLLFFWRDLLKNAKYSGHYLHFTNKIFLITDKT